VGRRDVLCGGRGADLLCREVRFDPDPQGQHEDVIYGGDGNDQIDAASDGQRDKLYCGEGWDRYLADKIDYVSSNCEKKGLPVVYWKEPSPVSRKARWPTVMGRSFDRFRPLL
jgi:hypothetical protein